MKFIAFTLLIATAISIYANGAAVITPNYQPPVVHNQGYYPQPWCYQAHHWNKHDDHKGGKDFFKGGKDHHKGGKGHHKGGKDHHKGGKDQYKGGKHYEVPLVAQIQTPGYTIGSSLAN